ncbi:MAG: hypothetical protein IT580_04965, partial [Verrucomicrobiales bacterium]|nr:hypothetical protein [Verrucomicrobiales bacterium]
FRPATVTPPTEDWFEGVAASADTAVAVGDNGAIYRSVGGEAWDAVTGTSLTEWLSGVARGNGVFVAVGEGGFVASSPDGTTWTRRSSGVTTDLSRVTFGLGQFVAVGDAGVILISTDGVTWERSRLSDGTTPTLLTAAVGADGILVAGNSALYFNPRISPGWQNHLTPPGSQSPAPDWTYGAALWDGQRFVLGGRTGVTVEGIKVESPLPVVELIWFRGDETPRSWLWDMERVGATYVAVGDLSTILTSLQGTEWALESLTSTASTVLYGVGGSSRELLAVGTAGAMYRSPGMTLSALVTNVVTVEGVGYPLVSTNEVSLLGVVWEQVGQGVTAETLQGVAWNGAFFVVTGGKGTLLRSADGTNWVAGSVPTTAFLSSVAASPDRWVATGSGGTIFSSRDGIAWEAQGAGVTNWVYRVRWLEDRWVAVGQKGLVLESGDGAAWTRRDSGTEAWLTDVRRVGGVFYVCGTQGTVQRSADLVSWEVLELPTGKSLYALASRDEQLLVAGAEGVVLRTLLESPVSRVGVSRYDHRVGASGAVDLFQFRGLPGRSFRLESAGDILNWEPAQELRLGTSGEAVWGRPAGEPFRFYRTVVAP